MRYIIACAALLMALSQPASAERAEDYVVHGVRVDVTSGNAEAAKEKALRQGEKQALDTLIGRLTAGKGTENFEIPPEQISAAVREMWIEKEKITANRYTASVAYKFDPDFVYRLMGEEKAPSKPKEDEAPPAKPLSYKSLLVPILIVNKTAILWPEEEVTIGGAESVNPWWQTWVKESENPASNLVLPMGDINDVQSITETSLMSEEYKDLAKAAKNYGLETATLAVADLNEQSGKLSVTIRKIPAADPESPEEISSASYPAENANIEKLLERGYREALFKIQYKNLPAAAKKTEDSEEREQADDDEAPPADPKSKEIQAIVEISGLSDWMDTNKKLKTVRPIKDITVNTLTSNRAVIQIKYSGSQDKLTRELKKAGLRLEFEDNFWKIKPDKTTEQSP